MYRYTNINFFKKNPKKMRMKLKGIILLYIYVYIYPSIYICVCVCKLKAFQFFKITHFFMINSTYISIKYRLTIFDIVNMLLLYDNILKKKKKVIIMEYFCNVCKLYRGILQQTNNNNNNKTHSAKH